MPTSPSTLDRPICLRARADVLAAAVRVSTADATIADRWVVTDPITREHFELSHEEYTALGWLDGEVSLRELQRRFEEQFAPRRIEPDALWRFLNRLHRDGLAVGAASGQGDELWRRDRRRRRDNLAWSWTKLLSIRGPRVDADRFTTSLHAGCAGAFRPWLAGVAIALVLIAVAIVIGNAGRLAADVPSIQSLVAPQNLLLLAATAIVVKALHELGHALACKHFGGEVREMGILFLAFAPCLYCDVSDMWRQPTRWKRIAVSGAGIFVELLLAAAAVIVWRVAEPGVVRSLAMTVMIVCTVGTLAINANPLLRYDGYYLLSDLTGVSNLWQRSRDAIRSVLSRWFVRQAPRQPARVPLVLYGLASQAYLLVIVTTIIWLVAATLKPMHLEAVAWAIGAVSLASVAAGPMRGVARWAKDPAAASRLRSGRITVAAVLVALLLAGILRMPWTYTVEGQAETILAQTRPVVATAGGVLIESARSGDRITAGEVVARLSNPDVEQQLLEIRGKVAEQAVRVDQLEAMRARDAQARDTLPAEKSLLDAYRRQLADREADAERLILRAETDGVLVSPVRRNDGRRDRARLSTWCGHPLDPQNLGAWIEPGTVVCEVAASASLAAEALLPEADVERLRSGQTTRVALRQAPGVVLQGYVAGLDATPVRPEPTRAASPQLNNWSPLQPPPSTAGSFYRVRIAIDDQATPVLPGLLPGGAGKVKIDTGSTTLGHWLADGLRQTFRLP